MQVILYQQCNLLAFLFLVIVISHMLGRDRPLRVILYKLYFVFITVFFNLEFALDRRVSIQHLDDIMFY